MGEQRLLWAVAQACALGPKVGVQHRHPGAATRPFLAQARQLAALCARQANPLFVSARLDVALLVGAHLHLPVDAPRAADVRRHLPAGRWVSASVHDEAELLRAEGADLLLLSPVFQPGSKRHDTRPTLGPEGYARLRARSRCPAFALGGIQADRLPTLGGVEGAAVQSAVLAANDPSAAAAELLAALSAPGAPAEALRTG